MSNYEFWDELGKIFNAVVAYQEKTVEFNKRFINPWIRLGNVFDKQDRNEEAIDAYKKALEIDPKNAQNWYEVGNIHFRMGKYDDAICAFSQAIELDPGFGWPYSNMALTYVSQGKFMEAIPLYRQSIEYLTEDKDKAVTWNRLGNLYRKLNEYELAVESFQKADELDHENAGFRDNLDEQAEAPTVVQENADNKEGLAIPVTLSLSELISAAPQAEESVSENTDQTAALVAPSTEVPTIPTPAAVDQTEVVDDAGLAVATETQNEVSGLQPAGSELGASPIATDEVVEASSESPVAEQPFSELVVDVPEVVVEVTIDSTIVTEAPDSQPAAVEVEPVVITTAATGDETPVGPEVEQQVPATMEVPQELNTAVPVVSTEEVVTSADVAPISTDEIAGSADVAPISTDEVAASTEAAVVSTEEVVASAEAAVVSTEEVVASADVAPISTDEVAASAEALVVSTEEVVASVDTAVTSPDDVAAKTDAVADATEEVASSPDIAVDVTAKTDEVVVSEETITIVVQSSVETFTETVTLTDTSTETSDATLNSAPVDSAVDEPAAQIDEQVVENIEQNTEPAPVEASLPVIEETNRIETPAVEAIETGTAQVEIQVEAEEPVVEVIASVVEAAVCVEETADQAVSDHPAYDEYLKDSNDPIHIYANAAVDEAVETGSVPALQEPIAKIDSAGELQIEMDTKNAHVWNELGNVYFNTGAFDDAVTAYSKAIELDRWFAWPYSNLALTYVQKGRFVEAILLYQRSIELFTSEKDKAVSWNRLGNVYRRINDYENAIAAYQRADDLDPDNTTLSLQSRFSLLGSYVLEQKPTYVS